VKEINGLDNWIIFCFYLQSTLTVKRQIQLNLADTFCVRYTFFHIYLLFKSLDIVISSVIIFCVIFLLESTL